MRVDGNSDTKSGGGNNTSEPYYVHIQQELVQSKMREAEAASRIVTLQVCPVFI